MFICLSCLQTDLKFKMLHFLLSSMFHSSFLLTFKCMNGILIHSEACRKVFAALWLNKRLLLSHEKEPKMITVNAIHL